MRVYMRWMLRRDMPEILDIENESFDCPWNEEDFIRCLRKRNCIGRVAEHDDSVVGFVLYELEKTRIWVANIAVAKELRRQGIGRTMASELKQKLSQQRRTSIAVPVVEKNLEAQLFFRACDFRAVSIMHAACERTGQDAYLMRYVLEEQPHNRIAEHLGELWP